MKKRAWKGLAIAAAAITLGAGLLFAGCDTQADGTDALSEVYAQAVELGYEGTLEDFIAQLRGEDGKDGADGAPGAPGKDGEDGKDGAPGKDGVGISSATVNSEGRLILFFTDGNVVDCGVVTGEAGAQGVGIRQIAFVGEELVITLSDGTLINCGRIPACAHAWSAWETQLAPTCTGIGYQMRSCSVCQRTEYAFLQAEGHTFGEEITVVERACEEEGLALQVCTVCGGTRAQELSALGHTYADGVCTRCGMLKPSGGLEFFLIDGGTGYKVAGMGTCTDVDVVIPAFYNGLPVREIGNWTGGASSDARETLRSVVIPENVVRIDTIAFSMCSNLQQVTLPQGLQEIGRTAFFRCPKLKSIEIPASVTSMEGAFVFCGGLENITVAEGNPVYHSADNCVIETATGRVILCTQASVIPSDGSATTLASEAYNIGDDASYLVIPTAITAIESRVSYITLNDSAIFFYLGTQAQWANVSGREEVEAATVCFYSTEDPFAAGAADGNYWHYAADGTPVLWQPPEEQT